MRNGWCLLALGAMVMAAPLTAQERDGGEPRERERAREFRMDDGGGMHGFVFGRRARLGVSVNLRARETDSLGAYIEAVTPNGPASKAGLRAGDVITKLDGQTLAGAVREGERTTRGGDRSLPGVRLIELAAKLEPEDTVAVEYRRGNDTRTTRVITEGDDGDVVVRRFGGPGGRGFAYRFGEPGMGMGMGPMERFEMEGPRFRMMFGGPLMELELAPLNEDLGRYFGTSEGVLVINVPKESELGLRGGDVVLGVDGRKPTGPGHLLRILRTYEEGETVKLEVMRNRKRETVTAKLPERPEARERRRPAGRRGERASIRVGAPVRIIVQA